MLEQVSPKCQEGNAVSCLACPRFWWVEEDKIALTCKHWCHEFVVTDSRSNVRANRNPLEACPGGPAGPGAAVPRRRGPCTRSGWATG